MKTKESFQLTDSFEIPINTNPKKSKGNSIDLFRKLNSNASTRNSEGSQRIVAPIIFCKF